MPTTYAIPDGRTVMAATLYTGDGTSTKSFSNAVNGVSFQPDLVWQKIRSGTTQGTGVFDSIRGTTGQALDTAATTAEGTWNGANASDYGYVSAFNSDGFSVNDGAIATTGGYVNYSARTYVAWQWKAGGTSASNTNGSITSSVSANTTAGFSVVTYTGTGANATVGHGLGVAPSMAIIKRRSTSGSNWLVFHTSMTATSALYLNTTEAKQTFADIWNNTAPTSTVMSLGTTDNCNLNGGTYVGYFFAAVAGYSTFGSYTGNGSTDGPFVFTNFQPRWLMIKRTDSSPYNWVIVDTARNTYNVANAQLSANLSDAENTSYAAIDLNSNGFKMRTTDGAYNASGGTYVYACFASNPMKYANAR